MNALKNIFGSSREFPPLDICGRYNERYYIDEDDQVVVDAERLFKQGDRLQAYRKALASIATRETVRIEKKGTELFVNIEQGSTQVHASITHDRIQARATVIQYQQPDAEFFLDLLKRNDSFQHIRFAIDSDKLVLCFDSLSSLCSPMQLIDALRELAICADKSDDFLLDAYTNIQRYREHELQLIPKDKREIYTAFAVSELEQGFVRARQYEEQFEIGLASRCLLGSCYLIDYITSPHGATQERLESMHRQFFERNAHSIQVKFSQLKQEANALLETDIQQISQELHDVKHTFGITKAIHRKKISAIVFQEMDEMTWYLREEQTERFLANAAYIVGYCLFHYAPPIEDRALLHLLVQLLRPHLFRQLGYTTYIKSNGSLKRAALKSSCKSLSVEYPALQTLPDQLSTKSLNEAIRSLLTFLVNRA